MEKNKNKLRETKTEKYNNNVYINEVGTAIRTQQIQLEEPKS